ncbi:MAG TPA: HlyD family secretion protein [Acidiferrobacterales bacterium]|nr:HlyD family secretion protein [Acidiferrobacterales bacterium]
MNNFKWIISLVLALAVIGGGYLYWRHGVYYPSTDDAYVRAHVVQVATQVTGPIAQVQVRDQQYVRQEDSLFELDTRSFALAVAQARARLALANQAMGANEASVRAAEAELANQQVMLRNAEDNAERVNGLRAQGFVSAQAYDNAEAAVKAARAQVAIAEAKLNQARMNLGSAGNQNERVREAAAALEQARLDLQHTRIAATCNGRIAELSLRPGDMVRAGTPLFSLVCDQEYWVDANFKETELGRIITGQPADITIDMYRGRHFRGRVENIGSASGTAFSLLPPQNATGNWVKVTQRVPVRVAILNADANFPLRVGTSAVVTIDTTTEDKALASTH